MGIDFDDYDTGATEWGETMIHERGKTYRLS